VTIGIWTLSDALSEMVLQQVLSLIFKKYYAALIAIQIEDLQEINE